MASFKILILRSKKYDFLLLSYLFFFFALEVLTPTQLAILNPGKENLWASCSLSGNKTQIKYLPHFPCVSLFRKVEKHITHAFTQLDTQCDSQSVDAKQLLSLFAHLHTDILVFSPSHSFYLSFSPLFTIVSRILHVPHSVL